MAAAQAAAGTARSSGGLFRGVHRITFVDIILWALRLLVLVVVVVGPILILMKGTYDVQHWFDFFMFGLTIGGVYALIALGYTMVYGILRLINFAHGDITMTGAFSAFFLARSFDQSGFLDAWPVTSTLLIMLLSMAVCTVTALLVERICYRPFRHVATLAPLICAIGASFVLQQVFRGMYGSTVRSYPDAEWLKGTIDLFGFQVPVVQPIVILTALGAMIFLYLIVQKTKMGMAMRAVSEDRDAAALMGIDANRVIIFTFILGACMAGIGGVLYCLVYKQILCLHGLHSRHQGLQRRRARRHRQHPGRHDRRLLPGCRRKHGPGPLPRGLRHPGLPSVARPHRLHAARHGSDLQALGPDGRKTGEEAGMSGRAAPHQV